MQHNSIPSALEMPSLKSTSNTNMAKKTAPSTNTVAPETPSSTGPRVRKTAAKAEVTVPVVPAATPAPVAETHDVQVSVRSADVVLSSLQESLRTLSSDVSSRLRAAIHEAQEAVRSLKREVRDSKRRRRVDPATLTPEQRTAWEARRANNAFLKLRPLSDELSTFMGLPTKSQRSQTDVTKFVSQYVKTHNCFDPNFKRRIIPDAKLSKLLRVKDGQEVTYLNLQSFLKVHFLKPATA